MITIEKFGKKLANILNGIDPETSSLVKPNDLIFSVLTYGSHFDRSYNPDIKRNFIPVFVSQTTPARLTPVYGLEECYQQFQVILYFPLHLKESIYEWCNFLIQTFVGQMRNFGDDLEINNGVCNMDVGGSAEIDNHDTQAYKDWFNWLENEYKVPQNDTYSWGYLPINIYITTYKNLGQENGFLIGNIVSYVLSYNNGTSSFSETPIFSESSLNVSLDPVSQQMVGAYETKSLIANSSYGKGFSIYLRDNEMGRDLIAQCENGTLQACTFTLTTNYKFAGSTISYVKSVYPVGSSLTISKGDPITMSFSFTRSI